MIDLTWSDSDPDPGPIKSGSASEAVEVFGSEFESKQNFATAFECAPASSLPHESTAARTRPAELCPSASSRLC